MSLKTLTFREYEASLLPELGVYNDIPFILLSRDAFEYASHWIPCFDFDLALTDHKAKVTLGYPYRLYFDEYSDEHIIIDDEKDRSMVYMAHAGDWVVLRGCRKWNDYVRKNWQLSYPNAVDDSLTENDVASLILEQGALIWIPESFPPTS